MNEIMEASLDDLLKSGDVTYDFEAIIYPDGTIGYARPSHIEAMMKYTRIPRRKIEFEYMPIFASPIIWLTGFTGCIPVWETGFYWTYNMTDEQKEMISNLVSRGLIKNNILCRIEEGETIVLNQDRDKIRMKENEDGTIECGKCATVMDISILDSPFMRDNIVQYCPKCGCEMISKNDKTTDYIDIDEIINSFFNIYTKEKKNNE